MRLHFYKYQGAGNDFIIVDGRVVLPKLTRKEIHQLCNRRFGIGADGLMIIDNATDVDFSMRYFNADGGEGTMCGNGGRCIVAFAAQREVRFLAVDGIHTAKIIHIQGNESQVCLGMCSVDPPLPYGKDGYYLNTGSPHLVFFGNDIAKLDVNREGAFWRNHPDFAPKGANVNFVEAEGDGTLFVRTFERGVEDETFACGTGVTASAIAAYMRSVNTGSVVNDSDVLRKTHEYAVRTLGGNLHVSFESKDLHFTNVQLTGPATFVFEGEIEL